MKRQTVTKAVNISPAMIQELAAGWEDGSAIARHYGFTSEEWETLSQQEWLLNQVERAKVELEKSGQTTKNKAVIMADKLLEDLYATAMGIDVPVKEKATALQVISRIADLEPKKDTSVAATGPSFSISISLPKSLGTEQVVEAEVVEKDETDEFSGFALDLGGKDG